MARMFSFAFMPWPIVLMRTIENSGVDEDFEIMIERYKYSYFKVINKRKLSFDQKNFLSSQLAHHHYVLCDGYFCLIFYGRFILKTQYSGRTRDDGGVTPLSAFFLIFMQFSAKVMPNNRLAPPCWRPSGKSWIRHCKGVLII